ncbi:hypothetical protein O181_116929 [Austropuccinia psidii MF-1]|uniref:Integrase catalytic domain-containing protein n=1 Tax=Austropuccinia psidii MF-1 TaxID=1389203 RepID=A0A9Q3K9S1_9BASI|nr:hypothetical protein [Austropuccinia psidii MF-1]
MDWVTELPPSGDKSYNAYLAIVDRYSKSPILLPCHKDNTAMDTVILLWNRVISHTGLFKNIISDRDSTLTSAVWANLHRLFGTKLSFSRAYHPQTDILEEIMIQTSEEMVRRFCAYGLEFKCSYSFTNDWGTQIPALELKYKTEVHFIQVIILLCYRKGWNPRLPEDMLRKGFIYIHPKSSSFKVMLFKLRDHPKQSMN